MRIFGVSILTIILAVGIYWAGTQNLVGKAVGAVSGAVGGGS